MTNNLKMAFSCGILHEWAFKTLLPKLSSRKEDQSKALPPDESRTR